MTQGVALGWHVTGPLALDTSASQPFFGYQPVFHLSWYEIKIARVFTPQERAVVFPGDCLKLLSSLPDECLSLVVTSPPYNIGKSYEKRNPLAQYAEGQRAIIHECVRALKLGGSICWQVGNYVDAGAIVPLDCLLFPVLS